MADNNPKPPGTGLSLYADLLKSTKDESAAQSGSAAEHASTAANNETDSAKKQQNIAASLRFQPLSRPQAAAQKAKAKAIASKLSAFAGSANRPRSVTTPAVAQASATSNADNPGSVEAQDTPAPDRSASNPIRATAADWRATQADDDDAAHYFASNRQRGGRRNKKKKHNMHAEVKTNWDDIYDPTKPTNLEEYKKSDHRIAHVRDWKATLYRNHPKRKKYTDDDDHTDYSDDNDNRPRNQSFAPPSAMSFAPPTRYDDNHPTTKNIPPPPPPPEDEQYIPPPPGVSFDDASGEDAFARRMRMSQGLSAHPQPPPPPSAPQVLAKARPHSVRDTIAALSSDDTIKGEPVMYDRKSPEQQDEVPATDSRSSRPGQAKFAERMMAKYGWEKGQGLGKDGTGVTTALYAKADKRKKKSDAEGGGFVTPSATGRILGGTKSKAAIEAEESQFGNMSEVVRLQGMLKGMDMRAEVEGGIMQEIGDECNKKYGAVQRVYIHKDTEDPSGPFVFLVFVSQLSALRAVNALEGRTFGGNQISARYWDREMFDQKNFE